MNDSETKVLTKSIDLMRLAQEHPNVLEQFNEELLKRITAEVSIFKNQKAFSLRHLEGITPSGIYAGKVLYVSNDKVWQQINSREAVAHNKSDILERMPDLKTGNRIEVRYRVGKCSV